MIELLTESRKKITEVKFAFPNEIDGVIKDLLGSPSNPYTKAEDIVFVRKFFVHEKAVTAGEGLSAGQVKHFISTKSVDRQGEIMEPKGADLRQYRKNPIVLWGHSYGDPDNIVGKNLWIKTDENGIGALTQFDLEAEKAAKIYRLFQKGILRGWSVGFIPMKGHRPKKEGATEPRPGEIIIDVGPPKAGEARWVHDTWLLLEYSAVSIPSNPDALTEAVAKELELGATLTKELLGDAEELVDRSAESGKSYFDMGGKRVEEEEEEREQAPPEAPEPEGEPEDEDGLPGKPDDELMEPEGKGYPAPDEYAMKPYPNEHACRVRKPEDFENGSFRTMERDHEGKKYRVLMGRLIGEKTMTEQGYRYPKEIWTPKEAKDHCKSHSGILFEPAGKGVSPDEGANLKAAVASALEEYGVKVGRVLSEKNRKSITAAMTQMEEAIVAMRDAGKALKELLSTADAAPEEKPARSEEAKIISGEGPGVALEIEEPVLGIEVFGKTVEPSDIVEILNADEEGFEFLAHKNGPTSGLDVEAEKINP